MPTVLITGANRGIGLEFAKEYAKDGWKVIATCRNPVGVGELGKIAGDVAVYSLHVDDDRSVKRFAADIKGTPVDVLINNAGVYGPKPVTSADASAADWAPVFLTNAMSPLFVSRALLPNVLASERKVIVNISSIMGSIANGSGPSEYIYRSSKAALNMVMACYAQEVGPEGATVVMFHPGWVRTDMGGPQATLSVEESVSNMRRVIGNLSAADNGAYLNYDGKPLPW